MRELLFRNRTSSDHGKKDLYFSEVIKRNGVICKSEKEHHYIIRKEGKFQGLNDLKTITKKSSPRRISIMRTYSSKLGKEMFACNVRGNFYFIHEGCIYSVLFDQSFKIDFIKSKN